MNYRPKKMLFAIALFCFLLLPPMVAWAEEAWEEIGDIYAHPTYLEAHLAQDENRAWMMELTGYGFLDIMLPFLPDGLTVSLWSLHNRSSVRVAQWSSETDTNGDILALAPGIYELRAQAEISGPLQARLRFLGVSNGGPDPGFYRNEGPMLHPNDLVHGFFGFRHAASPVFPNLHSRQLVIDTSTEITFSLISPDESHNLQLAVWQGARRLRSTSLNSAGKLTLDLEPGHYAVTISTAQAQVPQEYWLHTSTAPIDESPATAQYALLLQEHSNRMGRQSILLVLSNPLSQMPPELVCLTDSLGRTLPVKIEHAGSLLLVKPSIPVRSGQMVDLRLHSDAEVGNGVPSWNQQFRIP